MVIGQRVGPQIEITLGDITTAPSDVLVNSVCPNMAQPGKLDRAVRRRGGPEIEKELEEQHRELFAEGLPIGACVVTSGGLLPCKWVVHAAAPLWGETARAQSELAATYARALHVARDLGADVIAVPALGAGGGRFPPDEVAEIALSADQGATVIEIDAPRDRQLQSGDIVGLQPKRFRIFAAPGVTALP